MLASSSLRNDWSLPGNFVELIPLDVRCVGTGRAESGSGLSGSVDFACTGLNSAGLAPAGFVSAGFAAATTSPEPVALTFTFGPICITVIEIDLPALENSITAMFGWLMTEGCSFQPAGLSDAR